jgi:hypothetical protein
MKTKVGCAGVLVLVVLLVALCGWGFSYLGVGGWGPTRVQDVTVTKCWVDYSKDSDGVMQSHYMVGTDQGVFEVANGWLLGMCNADVVYGKLEVGKRYTIKTKGNQHVNFAMQYYPYIVKVTPLN